ncbi:hypothetical protein [Microbacterium sp. XT11]|uniref:hypothetical protein n=1 Tax=Microbacterium sp. XT11 TaxID=367477 RepID=UPI000830E2DE|nr:hypothetical protein [Microbacterium sp. XT11]
MTTREPSAGGLAAARRLAGWELGDPSWANAIISAYLNPETAHARMDEDEVPARTGTFSRNLS